MASFRKIGRNWFYRFVDGDGIQRERKGCPDRRETEGMAAAAEAEAAKVRAGIIDPKDRILKDHEASPLTDHLADWLAFLEGKGSTPKHAHLSHNRAARVVELSRARRISELTPSRVQHALKRIRDDGASLRSLHHYTRAVKGFSRWLWRDGRAREDALAHLTSQNPDADKRRERRALSPEEQARLIQAAEAGGVLLKTTGSDRAALYRLALGTGFRANELRTLSPERFDLDANTPTVTVAAAYSKRRRDDVQPIRPDLAEALRPWLATKPPGRPIFGNLTKHTNLLIQADLEAARIPYWDASGRVADFHALRHSFVTALAMSKAPVKVIQSLARHSTPTLTLGIYAHVGLHDQTAALDALPSTAPTRPETEAEELAATGTDGKHTSNRPSLYFPYGGDGMGRNLSVTGDDDDVKRMGYQGHAGASEPVAVSGFDANSRPLSDPGNSGGGGIRTHGRFDPTAVFKTAPIGHSGTPPIGLASRRLPTGRPRSTRPRRRRSARPRSRPRRSRRWGGCRPRSVPLRGGSSASRSKYDREVRR